MGLSYVFRIDLQRLIHCPGNVFLFGQWWRLDRFGLGRDGPFLSTISRRLRMRPERIRKPVSLHDKHRT